MKTTITPGQIIKTRSLCDYDCIYTIEILSRSENGFAMVKLEDQAKPVRRKIYTREDGREYVMAFGKYSMARTMRSGGVRYELVSVGSYKDLRTDVEQRIRDLEVAAGTLRLVDGEYYSKSLGSDQWFRSGYVHPTKYNSGRGEYLLKFASMAQCLKWKELEYFEVCSDRERYQKEPAILWKRSPLPPA